MKLFGCTTKLIGKTKNGESMSRFEVIGVVFVQCHLVDNQYQKKV